MLDELRKLFLYALHHNARTDGSDEEVLLIQQWNEAVAHVQDAFGKDPNLVCVVRCAECAHRPTGTGVNHDVHFPSDDFTCPCRCDDSYYSWMPPDDWYCASGKRTEGGHDD